MIKKRYIFIYDFDGVMTNNNFLLDEKGREYVTLNRSDGLAIKYLKEIIFKQIIVTTEKKPFAKLRSNKLDIECFDNINDKAKFFISYQKDFINYKFLFIGNDLNDLELLNLVDISMCPIDAHDTIKKICKYTLPVKGGDGVIMNLFNLLNKKKIKL